MIPKTRLCSAINKCNENFSNFRKNSVYPKTFHLNKYLLLTSTALTSITSQYKKSLQKLLNTQQEKLFSPTNSCSLPTLTTTETNTNLTQYELFQK